MSKEIKCRQFGHDLGTLLKVTHNQQQKKTAQQEMAPYDF